MTSFFEVILRDADLRVGKLSIPVADVALPAGYQTKIDAVTDALTLQPVDKPILEEPDNLYQTRVVIDQAVVNANPPTAGDLRDAWELLFRPTDPANGTKIMRTALPGRPGVAAAFDPGSKGYLVNQADPAYAGLVTALGAAGLDVKVNYPTFASADLIGARARSSARRTTALSGGVVPGQATAISHLEIITRDARGLKNVCSIPVASVALPAGYQTKIDATIDALTGANPAGSLWLFVSTMVWFTRVVIEQTPLTNVLPGDGSINEAWRFQAIPDPGSGYIKPFTFSMGCRNPDGDLTTESSKGKLIDTANDNFQSLITALSATGVGMVVPYQTNTVAELDTAFAVETRRKAPNL